MKLESPARPGTGTDPSEVTSGRRYGRGKPQGEAMSRVRNENAALLLVSLSEADRTFLAETLGAAALELHSAKSVDDAIKAVTERPIHLIICEHRVERNRSWKDLLAELCKLADPPPLIVATRAADHCVWAEVLNAGGYDVLSKPFRPEEVSHAVSIAVSRSRPILQTVNGTGAVPPETVKPQPLKVMRAGASRK